MPNRRQLASFLASASIAWLAVGGVFAADAPSQTAPDKRAVMTGEQVIQILDETVDWYRTLGVQQQSATQPSDLLILYANRQTADKVVNLAFELARANAELLSSDAEMVQASAEAAGSPQALQKARQDLDARRTANQAEVVSLQKQIAAAPAAQKSELQAKLAEVQSELDLDNARRNLLDTMTQFVYQTDANGSGASALKEHIDAIAASIPSANPNAAAVTASGGTATTPAGAAASNPLLAPSSESGSPRLGIWDLAANVWRLQAKLSAIQAVDQRTADLQETFRQIRTRPIERVRDLSARGDSLAQQADSADGA